METSQGGGSSRPIAARRRPGDDALWARFRALNDCNYAAVELANAKLSRLHAAAVQRAGIRHINGSQTLGQEVLRAANNKIFSANRPWRHPTAS